MNKRHSSTKTLPVPKSLIKKMVKTIVYFGDLEEELENYLLSQSPSFIKKMRQIRKEHLSGKVRPLNELKDTASFSF